MAKVERNWKLKGEFETNHQVRKSIGVLNEEENWNLECIWLKIIELRNQGLK